MRMVNAQRQAFEHCGEAFELIVFQDADDPHTTFFRVMKNERLFPLKVLGGHLSYVTFQVADEVESDAKALGLDSPLAGLLAEAKRMIEATLNG